MRLELVEFEEGAEEGTRGQAEAAQEVRAEDSRSPSSGAGEISFFGARWTRTWSLPGSHRVLRRKSMWSAWTLEPSQSPPYCMMARS